MLLAKASRFDYPCGWEWLGPGGLPGLQNLWRVALRAAVGSTPIHSRLSFHLALSGVVGVVEAPMIEKPYLPLCFLAARFDYARLTLAPLSARYSKGD